MTGLSEVDYSQYPGRELQAQWLRAYLEAYNEYKGLGVEVSEAEVEVLYVQVNHFALVSMSSTAYVLLPPGGSSGVCVCMCMHVQTHPRALRR